MMNANPARNRMFPMASNPLSKKSITPNMRNARPKPERAMPIFWKSVTSIMVGQEASKKTLDGRRYGGIPPVDSSSQRTAVPLISALKSQESLRKEDVVGGDVFLFSKLKSAGQGSSSKSGDPPSLCSLSASCAFVFAVVIHLPFSLCFSVETLL